MESMEIIMALTSCVIMVLLCIIMGLIASRESDCENDNEIDSGINEDCEERRQFHRDAAVYFENGLIHEIYNTKNYSICNFANHGYALFFYPISEGTKEANRALGPVGIFLNVKFIKKLIRKPACILELGNLSTKDLNALSFRLNQENFLRSKEIKAERDQNGPSSEIDLEMEKVLLAARETGSKPDVNHPVFDPTPKTEEKQNNPSEETADNI